MILILSRKGRWVKKVISQLQLERCSRSNGSKRDLVRWRGEWSGRFPDSANTVESQNCVVAEIAEPRTAMSCMPEMLVVVGSFVRKGAEAQ